MPLNTVWSILGCSSLPVKQVVLAAGHTRDERLDYYCPDGPLRHVIGVDSPPRAIPGQVQGRLGIHRYRLLGQVIDPALEGKFVQLCPPVALGAVLP